jgi:hypothetical protein
MVDRLAKGMLRMGRRQRQHASSPFTYARDNQSATGIAGTRGRTDYQAVDVSGFVVDAFAFDFLFDVADLKFGDILLVPAKGDRITDESNNVFEVLDLPGQGAWRYTDQFQNRYRIHAKEVA